MSTYAALEPARLDVVPGAERTCQLTVRNTSDVVEAYRIDVLGDAGQWSSVEPSTLHVYPGAESTAVVRFAPPRSSRVPVGDVPFAVRVLPSERPQDAAAPEGVLTVAPFTATGAEILPRTSKGRRGARHEVAVDNRGNVPLPVALSGVDPDGQVAVRVRPATLVVPPGQAAFAAVAVRNRRRLWTGPPATHPFQVVVVPDGDTPIGLDANTVQTPVFPKGATKLAAGLAALALLLVAAWFLLLKPAVRSAAKDAVDKPLAQVAAQASSAAQQAAVAGSKADQLSNGGGAGAAPQATTAPAAPAVKTVTAPATVRLATTLAASGTAGTNTYTAPAKTTLVVTDIVLENPQGDAGRVDVLVDHKPILTLALVNFRDLDYHFVSPIEIPAGKTLSISTTCQVPGPAIAGTASGQCRVWLLASGSTRVLSAPLQ
jgi:hypothetical protein